MKLLINFSMSKAITLIVMLFLVLFINIKNWAQNFNQQAATELDNGKVYFFENTQYMRYDIKLGKIDEGYPAEISPRGFSKNWPAGWTSVDAAVNLGNGNIYFFRGNQYARYDIEEGRIAQGYPAKISPSGFSKNWPAGWTNVDAAVNLDNGSIYFFRGNQYARYDIEEGRIAQGYPAKISPSGFSKNWPCAINSAIPESHKGNMVDDLLSLWNSIPDQNDTDPNEEDIDGTYQKDYLTEYYFGAENHIQGLAKAGEHWILSHNANLKDKVLLVDPSRDKPYWTFGEGDHPGAIQACGDVVIVAAKGDGTPDKTYFVQVSDHKVLPVSYNEYGDAVGLAYHPDHNSHYAIIGDKAILKASGSLSDQSCELTKLTKRGDKKVRSGLDEGGTQLFYNKKDGHLYCINLQRRNGWETMDLDRIILGTNSDYTVENIGSKRIEKTSTDDFGTGFRWGGAVIFEGDKMHVYATERTLHWGPFAQFCGLSHWIFSEENSYEYEVKIDACHSDLDNTGTGNRISVEFWSGETYLYAKYRDGVSDGCYGADASFSYSSTRKVSHVIVKTDGGDAFYIDEISLKIGGDEVKHYGRDNGNGWCLSTDPNDANGSWKNYISGTGGKCISSIKFSF